MAELARDVIGKARGTHFRNRAAARRDHKIARLDRDAGAFALQVDAKAFGHVDHLGRQPHVGPPRRHFGAQHGDALSGFAVTE